MKLMQRLKDRPILEAEITKSVREYLKMKRIFHYKQWQGLGSLHGISDIIGILNGKYLAIEVKRPGKSPSPKQQAFLDRVNSEGGIGIIVRSVGDVHVFLSNILNKGRIEDRPED